MPPAESDVKNMEADIKTAISLIKFFCFIQSRLSCFKVNNQQDFFCLQTRRKGFLPQNGNAALLNFLLNPNMQSTAPLKPSGLPTQALQMYARKVYIQDCLIL